MKVYLIRHGEATHNSLNNVDILDPPLTDHGIEQCQKLRDQLQTILDSTSFSYNSPLLIISSSANRALQTACKILPQYRINATDLLLEYNTGVKCNQRVPLEFQEKRFPNVNFTTYKVDPLPIETKWEHGVTRAQRILNLISSIRQDQIPPIVSPIVSPIVLIIVSHQNIIRNIIHAHNGTLQSLENCGYYTMEF